MDLRELFSCLGHLASSAVPPATSWWEGIRFQYVQTVGIIVAILFTMYQFYRFRVERTRSVYLDADARYREFIKESMDLDTVPSSYDPSLVQHFLTCGGSAKELLMYDLLFSSWESAYLLYGQRRKSQWGGWEAWIADFFRHNPRCALAWDIAGRYFDEGFVRQVTTQFAGGGDPRAKRQFPRSDEEWAQLPVSTNFDGMLVGSFQIMQYWEEPIMRAMVETIAAPTRDVLEIGFGLGISAALVQERNAASHTILEAHPAIFARLREFAASHPTVRPVRSGWESWVREQGDAMFDSILFDTYPTRASEMHKNHFPFFPAAARLLRPGSLFTYYSDEALHVCPAHQEQLLAHFSEFSVQRVAVHPPADCEYWQAETMLVIVARKAA